MSFFLPFFLFSKILATDYYPDLDSARDAFNVYNTSINRIILKKTFANIISDINNKTDVITKNEKYNYFYNCDFMCVLGKVSVHVWCMLIIEANEPTHLKTNSNQMCHLLNDVGLKKFQNVLNNLKNITSIFKRKSEMLSHLYYDIYFTYNKTFEFVQKQYYEGQYTIEISDKFDDLREFRDELTFKINEACVDIETILSKLSNEIEISNKMITNIQDAKESFCSEDGSIQKFEQFYKLVELCRGYLRGHGYTVPFDKDEYHKFYTKHISKELKAIRQ